MGLAVRLIPTILCRGRRQVKGERFDAWRSVGLAEQAVRVHSAREVDEIVLLDIAATDEGRGPDLNLISELTDKCFMPITVGGGIRNVNQVRELLRAGADSVLIGTAAHEPDGIRLVRELADTVGSQAVVVSVDVRDGQVWTNCGRKTTRMTAVEAAIRVTAAGAGEIFLTSIEREGTMLGYDLDLISEVTSAVRVPVVAHGGCGTPLHMLEAIQAGANAVAAGAMFQFTDETPRSAAEYLSEHGVEVRLVMTA